MGFIDACRNLYRRLTRKFEEQTRDVVEDAKTAIEDSKASVQDFLQKIAAMTATVKGQERDLAEAKAQVEKWAGIAKRAADDQNVDAVTTAVTEKQKYDTLVQTLTTEIARNTAQLDKLKSQLDAARGEIETAENELTGLAARKVGADLRQQMATAANGLNNRGLAKLGELREYVETAEDTAEATEELSTTSAGAKAKSVSAQYSDGAVSVQDEVARLMADAKK